MKHSMFCIFTFCSKASSLYMSLVVTDFYLVVQQVMLHNANFVVLYFSDQGCQRLLIGPIRGRGQIRPSRNISSVKIKTPYMLKQIGNKTIATCPLL